MPTVAGFCGLIITEIAAGIFNILDEFYMKTTVEVVGFLCCFAVAQKMQHLLRIVVSAFFGAFLIEIGGCIMLDKIPKVSTVVKRGQKPPSAFDVYLPYTVLLAVMATAGAFV